MNTASRIFNLPIVQTNDVTLFDMNVIVFTVANCIGYCAGLHMFCSFLHSAGVEFADNIRLEGNKRVRGFVGIRLLQPIFT